MVVNVWLVYKAGEPRTYTWSVEPDKAQKAAFLRDGFRIFRAQIYLPLDEETKALYEAGDEVRELR